MRKFDPCTQKVLQSLKIATNLFSGDLKNLIDLSNIFSFCKLIYNPSDLDMLQETIESTWTLVVTDKYNLALLCKNRANFFCFYVSKDVCKNPDFYYVTNIVLVDIFDKYFEINLSFTKKRSIANMNIKEGFFSLMYKICQNAGVFDESFVVMNKKSNDVVYFLFQKYYQYKNKNKILSNLCEILMKNFKITGNQYLTSFFSLVEMVQLS